MLEKATLIVEEDLDRAKERAVGLCLGLSPSQDLLAALRKKRKRSEDPSAEEIQQSDPDGPEKSFLGDFTTPDENMLLRNVIL